MTMWASYQRSTGLNDYVGIVSVYSPGLCGHHISVVNNSLTMWTSYQHSTRFIDYMLASNHCSTRLIDYMWASYQRST